MRVLLVDDHVVVRDGLRYFLDRVPELEGIATTQQLHQHFSQVRVLALTSFAEGQLVQRALQAGAISYLLKDAPGAELVEAVRKASVGAPASVRRRKFPDMQHLTGSARANSGNGASDSPSLNADPSECAFLYR